jgi:hypothetical protein
MPSSRPFCPYCATDGKSMSADHIFPKSMGGVQTIPACDSCNHGLGATFDTLLCKHPKTRFASLLLTGAQIGRTDRIHGSATLVDGRVLEGIIFTKDEGCGVMRLLFEPTRTQSDGSNWLLSPPPNQQPPPSMTILRPEMIESLGPDMRHDIHELRPCFARIALGYLHWKFGRSGSDSVVASSLRGLMAGGELRGDDFETSDNPAVVPYQIPTGAHAAWIQRTTSGATRVGVCLFGGDIGIFSIRRQWTLGNAGSVFPHKNRLRQLIIGE